MFLQDGIVGGDRQHSPDQNSTSHNAELQDGTFVAAPGRSERVAVPVSRRLLFTELCFLTFKCVYTNFDLCSMMKMSCDQPRINAWLGHIEFSSTETAVTV